MTPEQMQIAIAEACGWKWYGSINGTLLMWPPVHGDCCEPLNYPGDLNACAEMEATLEPRLWSDYAMALRRVVQRDCDKPECYVPGADRFQLIADYWFYHATALQRCEAFLRTLNLYQETQ